MQKYANTVTDTLGNVVSLASVSVYTNAAHTVAATIWSDNGANVLPTNTVTTDSLGNFSFYAADGRYYLKVTKSGITTQFLDDVLLFDSTASNSAASINTVQSGIPASTRTVSQELRETISPLQFGGAGDGVTNDSAAVLAASVAAVAQGKDVDFGGHTWLLGTQIPLDGVSHPNLKWRLRGATIKKGFSGNLVTVTACPGFSIDGVGTIDGQHGTYTGKGFVFSGSGCTNPYFGSGLLFTSFTDTHIEFGADSGTWAKVGCNFQPGSGQTDYRAVHVNGPDTSARHRTFLPHVADSGYHQLDGALGFYSAGVACRRFLIDTASSVVSIVGGSWASTPTAIVIKGTILHIVGIRMSGNISFDSGATGHFAHNEHTSGTFSSAGISDGMTLFHRNTTTGTLHIGRNTLYAFASATERIQTSRVANLPDADATLTVGSSAPCTRFNANLTAARAVTLSTTGAVAGDRFCVSRSGGDTGGPWNLSVGGLKNLLTAQWCDVEFDGSGWVLTRFGSL